MTPPRVSIIPFLHGKTTRDGKLSEPDIYDILEKWLQRHPQVKTRQQDTRSAEADTRCQGASA